MPTISSPNMSTSHANDTAELFAGDSIDLSCVDGWRSSPVTVSFDCVGQQSTEGQWLPRSPSIPCVYIPLPRPPYLDYANLNPLSRTEVNAEAATPGSRFTPGISEVIYDCQWGGSTMIYQIQQNRTWLQIIGDCPLSEPTLPPTTAAPTEAPTEDAVSGASGGTDGERDSATGSGALAAVLVVAVIILGGVIAGAVIFIKKSKSKMAAGSRHPGASSFENPMCVPLLWAYLCCVPGGTLMRTLGSACRHLGACA